MGYKPESDVKFFGLVVAMSAVPIILGTTLSVIHKGVQRTQAQASAVAAGHARYLPDGTFEWMPPCVHKEARK